MFTTTITTANLFDAINAALIDGRLSDARRDLDLMLARTDNVNMLCDVSAYNLPKNQYGQSIADRIELVNSRARRAALAK